MATAFADYVKDRRVKAFKPVPHYFQSGDYVSHFISEERCYAERVDELLTVYRSNSTDALVGCKIKGVSRLLLCLNNFGVSVSDETVSLNYLFLAAALAMPGSRDKYQEWADRTKGDRISTKEFAPVNRIKGRMSELAGTR